MPSPYIPARFVRKATKAPLAKIADFVTAFVLYSSVRAYLRVFVRVVIVLVHKVMGICIATCLLADRSAGAEKRGLCRKVIALSSVLRVQRP